MIIAYDNETDSYTQHYFDSRGVVRIYKMGLRASAWTLLRQVSAADLVGGPRLC